MKKIIFSIFVLALVSACNNTPAPKVANTTPTTSIKFENDVFDFGKIVVGEKINHSFKFKNTGKIPLIISNAVASCGCTVPDWPKLPIKPNESAKIDIVFNTVGKMGLQDKTITITANTQPNTLKVHLIGEIIEK